MTKLPSRRQIPDNPLIAPESTSHYQCCFSGCGDMGVWSPTVVGPGPWFCRRHAGLSEPKPRRALRPSETVAFMRAIFGQSCDAEADLEREAIQSEPR